MPQNEVAQIPSLQRQPKAAPAGSHPVSHLVAEAERSFEQMRKTQSRTLKDAVVEYRRRYQMPPPPHFDQWFKFAQDNKVQLVDEFDIIHELITPFWGLKPGTIRSRAAEAVGYSVNRNGLMGIQIRGGNITDVSGGGDWQRDATQGMVAKFVHLLPDMDLAFNIHDEPRVVVPHEDMARLVNKARDQNMPAANVASELQNTFSTRPEDLNDGWRKTTRSRFNEFSHQATWTHARMSCSPGSPARVLEDDEYFDAKGEYGLSELGFVYNDTAMSDICLSPSLRETYGFFDRPNAFKVVQDLFPIFSQSKLSSFSDLIYPAPWYWSEKVVYDEEKDVPWGEKQDDLYWRGSTTGGFSRGGGWRRHHRQRLVEKLNDSGQSKILSNTGDESHPSWEVKEVPRSDHKDKIDVFFSDVGQCDARDCDAQKDFFRVKAHAAQQSAWQHKHLLDMDGNAYSGRFYAFLQSRSLVYKLSIFREWHRDWVRPWAHYVPLSLQGDDWLEAVRFFSNGGAGKKDAERLAAQSTDWARKALRKEDMEVWFFRLLLEYGRVVDDNRETIGFSL